MSGNQADSVIWDLRQALSNTLAEADDAVVAIEAALQTGVSLSTDQQNRYYHALEMRDRASAALKASTDKETLRKANEDAAQAVLALQEIMREGSIPGWGTMGDETTKLCFYCAHSDRAPYVSRVLHDDRGNNMEIAVCSLCNDRFAHGEVPEVAEVGEGNDRKPWFARSDSNGYARYHGWGWRVWLPLAIDVEAVGFIIEDWVDSGDDHAAVSDTTSDGQFSDFADGTGEIDDASWHDDLAIPDVEWM